MNDEFDKKNAVIRFFHVTKRYGSKNALFDITLDICENDFVFISGPSGAGKSTLLKLLYLGEPVSEGEIIVDGMNLKRINHRAIPLLRRKFGIIFQDFKLIPSKSAYENISLVLEAQGIKRSLIKKKVRSLLRNVGIDDKEKCYPPSLSGGEQQRVALARAIAGNPKIILADEPTGSLDAESAAKIFDLLKECRQNGATVLIATHDTELIRKTGGKVILLDQGRLDVMTVIPKLE